MRSNPVILGGVTVLFAMASGGCLEARGGLARHADATSPSDTVDTADTAETTAPDADRCGGNACDDGNPCTQDLCDAATGACQHLAAAHAAVPAEPYECTATSACDDGDPCTIDACSISQCAAGGWCTHQTVTDCEVGCASGCDDGNPCTDDGCVGDRCEHAALAECDAQCTSQGFLPVSQAVLATSGSFVKALGTVQMGRDLACTDDGICNCWSGPVLVDATSELALYSMANVDESSMFCRSHDGTPLQVSCGPMAVGVAYRAWGTGYASLPSPSGGAPDPGVPMVPPQVAGIAAEGFCLDTDILKLRGHYQMFFERWGATVELNAEFVFDEPGWLSIHIQGSLCPSCPPIDTWSVLEVLDNGVRFKFDAVFDDLQRGVVVRLASVANTLTGRWVLENYAAGPIFTLHWPATGDAASAGAGGAPPAPADGGAPDPYFGGGAMRLVRLPGDNIRSPCEWSP